jgi:hypothetical protein
MTIFAIATEYVNDFGDLLGAIAVQSGAVLGAVAFTVGFFNRLAKLVPTNWNNRFARWFSKVTYFIFAVLGAKVPDIEKIENGKIVTVAEAASNSKKGK